MGTLLNVARWLGLGLLVIAGAGAAVRVVFNEIMDLKRVSELGRALLTSGDGPTITDTRSCLESEYGRAPLSRTASGSSSSMSSCWITELRGNGLGCCVAIGSR